MLSQPIETGADDSRRMEMMTASSFLIEQPATEM